MRILFFFPRPMVAELPLIASGQIPSDRAYGLVELGRYGHEVAVADERFAGGWGRVVRALRRRGINACAPATFAEIGRYDVLVVKDRFSTLLSIASRAAQRKIVYLDAMFELPRRHWKDGVTRVNLALCDGVVAYSQTQIELWSERYGVAPNKFKYLPYTIDLSFFRPARPEGTGQPYVLSVGRDLGRDFETLAKALDGLGLGLKIVTLPYLLKGVNTSRSWIEVLENLSYAELFRLYANATLVVIPLKNGVTYPSGVRGLLEAMALGKPVVASRTPVLEEYASDGDGICFVDPEEPGQLRATVTRLLGNPAARARLSERAQAVVHERYGMEVFARGLERYLADRCHAETSSASHP